ncbi:MAG: hypothetical protein K2F71_03625, partial [Paramuribaculum sp.]|nr:hypothetical protein [Paramuribaculum sp.]
EYEVLLGELEKFNPELVNKQRILAVSKSDMLDEELIDEIRPTLPDDIPCVFISAVTGMGLTELKDILWTTITDDRNRIATPTITHRPLDIRHRVREEDEFIFEQPDRHEEDEEGEDYFNLGDDWGEDIDYDGADHDWEYGVNDDYDEGDDASSDDGYDDTSADS